MSDILDGPLGEILSSDLEDGCTRVECRFANETLWLSQALSGALFQKDVRTINQHLAKFYEEGKLTLEATIRQFRIVRQQGTRQVALKIDHGNLEAILAAGVEVPNWLNELTARLRDLRGSGRRMNLRMRGIFIPPTTSRKPTWPHSAIRKAPRAYGGCDVRRHVHLLCIWFQHAHKSTTGALPIGRSGRRCIAKRFRAPLAQA